MMGRLESVQDQFFYNFRLDDVVPTNHLVRRIDAVLDLSWLHGELEPYYSHTGRPSVDPRTDDANADHRICLRHSLGTSTVFGGPGQSGLSLVLPFEC